MSKEKTTQSDILDEANKIMEELNKMIDDPETYRKDHGLEDKSKNKKQTLPPTHFVDEDR
ncbi:MAG: hypothetical protein IJH12_02490 [Clostridia bacterium]|nr:hypothetical protein [Clostridia bacterium]